MSFRNRWRRGGQGGDPGNTSVSLACYIADVAAQRANVTRKAAKLAHVDRIGWVNTGRNVGDAPLRAWRADGDRIRLVPNGARAEGNRIGRGGISVIPDGDAAVTRGYGIIAQCGAFCARCLRASAHSHRRPRDRAGANGHGINACRERIKADRDAAIARCAAKGSIRAAEVARSFASNTKCAAATT